MMPNYHAIGAFVDGYYFKYKFVRKMSVGEQLVTAFQSGMVSYGEAVKSDRQALLLWCPVFLAIGIGGYFSLASEPPLALSLVVGGIFLSLTILLKQRLLKYLALLFCMVALGGIVAQLRSHYVSAPILETDSMFVDLEARVVNYENRGDQGIRLILEPIMVEGRLKDDDFPEKIRLTIRTDLDNNVSSGSIVSLRALIRPPPRPVVYGGHDFARDSWFDGIGAVGFSISPVRTLQPSSNVKLLVKIEQMRNKLSDAMYQRLGEGSGGIAAALVTGKRGRIDEEDVENLRDAGLAHLLAISGLHMALITGFAFYLVRALVALLPAIALRFTSKKIAAIGAWVVGLGYFFLTGQGVSPARAFIMVSVVFLAMFLNRRPISLRVVAFAAMILLLFQPESLLSVSFQMSFAAVVGLVVFFEQYQKWSHRHNAQVETKTRPWQLAFYFLSVISSTLVAELMIAPFSAWHFSDVSFYGLISNLIAIPVMAFWVMPWLFAGSFFWFIGAGDALFTPAKWGLDIIREIAEWVANLDGAVLHISVINDYVMIFFVLGLLWLFIWQNTQLRLLRLVPVVLSFYLFFQQNPADFVMGEEGKLIGVIDKIDNTIWVNNFRSERYTRETWQSHFSFEIEDINDYNTLAEGESNQRDNTVRSMRCANLGCKITYDQRDIYWLASFDLLFDACQRNNLIITELSVPRWCKRKGAIVLDRWVLRDQGASSIWFHNGHGGMTIKTVAQQLGKRPWVR